MDITLIVLAAFLTWPVSFKIKNLLISLSAGLLWFGLAVWFFFTPDPLPIFNLDDNYSIILVWVFMMLMFVPFLALMDTEIQMEKGGQKWREWGAKPTTKVNNYESYRKELQRRLRR